MAEEHRGAVLPRSHDDGVALDGLSTGELRAIKSEKDAIVQSLEQQLLVFECKGETYRNMQERLDLLQKMLGHVDEKSLTGRDTRVNAESLFALQRLLKEALGEIRKEGETMRDNLLRRESDITYERGLKGHFQHEDS